MKYIRWFKDISLTDIPSVGGKNASLGQMIRALGSKGIRVPNGFAITADAYWHHIRTNGLEERLQKLLAQLRVDDIEILRHIGSQLRELISTAPLPEDLAQEILTAYHELSTQYNQTYTDVAVRSSATAEDLPNASFAGQQETYLNVHSDQELLRACSNCFASLFTDRAIIYRIEKNFDHFKVGLSIGVQKMIRSDQAVSGVMFSLDPETGFKHVVTINASYGLGESIVQGVVTPDEYVVHKPTLERGYASIIQKNLGTKDAKMIYTQGEQLIKTVPVSEKEQKEYCLTDQHILELARSAVIIEDYYSDLKKMWCPMDIEWAQDGHSGELYIIQARPETVHATKNAHSVIQYRISDDKAHHTSILTGQSIGQKIAVGAVRVIRSFAEMSSFKEGEILVAAMTDPDWVPIMKKAAGIITDKGGRTCHAAIVSRELGVPAIVGTVRATEQLQNGQVVTIDCSSGSVGYVYDGALSFVSTSVSLDTLAQAPVPFMVNIADPARAFEISFLPVAGVGLARLEFIISNNIQIHPMALLHPELVQDKTIAQKIEEITSAYTDKKTFFIDKLASGVGTIAAAFYPKPVIVRLSDFKTNEYRNLLGGSYFEETEENPMLGFRGASRYYDERFTHAFGLECVALKKARDTFGLTNIKIMVPFVRTLQEAHKVCAQLAAHGLARGTNGLEIYMMCEIPSNVMLIEEFSKLFDGFSIGSNDLTQLTLGVDRDSQTLQQMFDERDSAVKKMLCLVIRGARCAGKPIGICGQAPSDYPELISFLIQCGISSISLNADAVLPMLKRAAHFPQQSFCARLAQFLCRWY